MILRDACPKRNLVPLPEYAGLRFTDLLPVDLEDVLE